MKTAARPAQGAGPSQERQSRNGTTDRPGKSPDADDARDRIDPAPSTVTPVPNWHH
jgi:hypothetical protein